MQVYVIISNRLIPNGKGKWDVTISDLRPSEIVGVCETEKAADKLARDNARRYSNVRKIEKTNKHDNGFTLAVFGSDKQPYKAYIIERQEVK